MGFAKFALSVFGVAILVVYAPPVDTKAVILSVLIGGALVVSALRQV